MLTITTDKSRRCYVLQTEVALAVDRETLFEFFSDAFQLESITPPFLNFEVITSAPIDIQRGTLIDYRLKLRGLPVRWRTEISEWNPPSSFTDRQIRGPYLMWEHQHTFEAVTGGTLVRDQVRYRVPGGAIVDRLLVRKDLRRIFRFRRDRLIERFGPIQPESKSSGSARPEPHGA